MVSRLVEHDGATLLITNESVALEDPGGYDCLICESSACRCQAELDRICALSPAELDAELVAEGVDPVALRERGGAFMRELFAAQGIVVASLGMGLDSIENVAGAGI